MADAKFSAANPLDAPTREAIDDMLARAQQNLSRARADVASGNLKRAQALIRATNAIGAAASQTMLAEAPGHA